MEIISRKSEPKAADPSAYTRAVEGLVLCGEAGSPTFSISAGQVVFADNYSKPAQTIEKELTFAGGDFALPPLLQTQTSAYVYLDWNGELGYSAIAPDLETLHNKLWLGYISSLDGGQTLSGAGITLVNSSEATLLSLATGSINIDGISLKPIAGGLQVCLPRTRLYLVGRNYGPSATERKLPDLSIIEEKAIAQITYLNQAGKIISRRQNELNFKLWDNNGVSESVPPGAVTVQHIYISADGGIVALLGQCLFFSLAELLGKQSGQQFVQPPILNGFHRITSIVAREDATDVSDRAKVAFLPADKFGQTSGLVADVFEPAEADPVASVGQEIRFSNRVYLRRNQMVSFSPTHGTGNSNVSEPLGSPIRNIRGFAISRAAKVTSLSLHFYANSSTSSLTFEPVVLKQTRDGTVESQVLAQQRPQTTNYTAVDFPLDIDVAAGDLLSIAWRRSENVGSSTYYLYVDGVFSLEPVY